VPEVSSQKKRVEKTAIGILCHIPLYKKVLRDYLNFISAEGHGVKDGVASA
jgi:hypothetical protein